MRDWGDPQPEDGRRRADEAVPVAAPTPGSALLALQRRAGNRAVVAHLARRDPDTVQRKLGFEFEIDVPVVNVGRQSSTKLSDHRARAERWITGASLGSKVPIEDHPGPGFHIETDSGDVNDFVDEVRDEYVDDKRLYRLIPSGRRTARCMEYVTDPLNETVPGVFDAQIAAVTAHMENLRDTKDVANYVVRAQDERYYLGIPNYLPLPRPRDQDQQLSRGRFEEKVADARRAVSFRSYTQATAGIDVTKMKAFLENEDPDLVSGDLHEEVVTRVRAHSGDVDDIMGDAVDDGSARGFLTTVLQYVVGYAVWQSGTRGSGHEKNMVPFWFKIDLPDYYKQLPEPARLLIKARENFAFERLRAVYNEETARRGGIKRPIEHFVLTSLLTGAFRGDRQLLEGLRPTFDENRGPHGGAPVELRSISERPEPGNLMALVNKIVNKVRALNSD